MENDLHDLKQAWKSGRPTQSTQVDSEGLIQEANARRRSSQASHYGNIILLSTVAIMLAVCWHFFFPFREWLSRVGISAMIGGLIVRVIIEIFSVAKSKQIQVTDATAEALAKTVEFYEFRKRVHGPVTISIVTLYVIAFYSLSLELRHYISLLSLVAWDLSFLIGAVFMVVIVRRALKREMEDLRTLLAAHKHLVSTAEK